MASIALDREPKCFSKALGSLASSADGKVAYEEDSPSLPARILISSNSYRESASAFIRKGGSKPTYLRKPTVNEPQVLIMICSALSDVIELSFESIFLPLVFEHLAKNGFLLEFLLVRIVLSACARLRRIDLGRARDARQREGKWVEGTARTSSSSLPGRSAS